RRSRSAGSTATRSSAPTRLALRLGRRLHPHPTARRPTRIPKKARIGAFTCVESHGLIWAALEEPRWDLPDVPELAAEGWTVVTAGPYTWSSDASRQLENFTDFGHFPWVHPGLLGDPSRPVVPEHTVETDGHVLRY